MWAIDLLKPEFQAAEVVMYYLYSWQNSIPINLNSDLSVSMAALNLRAWDAEDIRYSVTTFAS